MSKIDEMIKELCPEGVEKVTLGDYVELYTGVQLNKSDMKDEGSFPVINGGILPSGYIENHNEPQDTITISQGGASAGYVNYLETPFWAGAHCFVIRPKTEEVLLNRYLYQYIKQSESYLQQSQQGAGIPSVNRDKIKGLEIPLPPLPIQQEIVSVLDSFTTLIDKMKQEVEKRKKQMEYYREELLTFADGECEWKTLGELGYSFNGLTGKSKKDFENGNSVFVTYSNIFSNPSLNMDIPDRVMISEGEKQNIIQKGDILFTGSSETPDEAGMSSVVLKEPSENMYLNSFCFGLRLYSFDTVKPDYLKYLLRSKRIRDSISMTAFGVTRFNINKEKFFKVVIPIPSLNRQNEIATTLDKFESYITKLEKMITLRQKQYEYYREQLLTF